jgi:hypothetical protein
LCINLAQSAHTRRETYVGTWLPEPVDTSADPAIGAERDEALKLAVLLLLEKLSPTERAAYVLREAFDYPYRQIAEILQTEEANVRQLVSRARKHIADGRRASVSLNEQRRFLAAVVAAGRHGGTGRPLRGGCCFLLRWRWTCARGGSSSYWSQACRNVYCRCFHLVLEGCDA